MGKGAAACIMKRLLALTHMRAQLALHQPVLDGLLALMQALQQHFPGHIEGGLYTLDVRPLVHQVSLLPNSAGTLPLMSVVRPILTFSRVKLSEMFQVKYLSTSLMSFWKSQFSRHDNKLCSHPTACSKLGSGAASRSESE